MRKLRSIFALAAAAFVLAFTPACAQERPQQEAPVVTAPAETVTQDMPNLLVGQGGTPAQVGQALQSEGHITAFRFNNGLRDQNNNGYFQRNLITADEDMNWYLLKGDAPLGGDLSVLQVEFRGTDLRVFEEDYESKLIPAVPFEQDMAYIKNLRDNGRQVLPRTLLVSRINNQDNTTLSFSAIVRNNQNQIIGTIDGLSLKDSSGGTGVTIVLADTKGAARAIKIGQEFDIKNDFLQAFNVNPIDLDTAAQSATHIASTGTKLTGLRPN